MSETETRMDDIDCEILAELAGQCGAFRLRSWAVAWLVDASRYRARAEARRARGDPRLSHAGRSCQGGLPVRAFVKVTVAGDMLANFQRWCARCLRCSSAIA